MLDEKTGDLFLGGNKVLLLSRGQVAWIQRELEKIAGPSSASIMYLSSKLYSQKAVSKIQKVMIKVIGKISKNALAKEMLKEFSVWGLWSR